MTWRHWRELDLYDLESKGNIVASVFNKMGRWYALLMGNVTVEALGDFAKLPEAKKACQKALKARRD